MAEQLVNQYSLGLSQLFRHHNRQSNLHRSIRQRNCSFSRPRFTFRLFLHLSFICQCVFIWLWPVITVKLCRCLLSARHRFEKCIYIWLRQSSRTTHCLMLLSKQPWSTMSQIQRKTSTFILQLSWVTLKQKIFKEWPLCLQPNPAGTNRERPLQKRHLYSWNIF